MRIADGLYTYGFGEKKLDRIIQKINKGKKIPKLYVIVLPLFRDGLLEIYVYDQLFQPYYQSLSGDIMIVGVSKNKAGAQELVLNMIQDMLDTDLFPAKDSGENIRAVKEFFGI